MAKLTEYVCKSCYKVFEANEPFIKGPFQTVGPFCVRCYEEIEGMMYPDRAKKTTWWDAVKFWFSGKRW